MNMADIRANRVEYCYVIDNFAVFISHFFEFKAVEKCQRHSVNTEIKDSTEILVTNIQIDSSFQSSFCEML